MSAIGITLIASSVSGTKPKLIHCSRAINPGLTGATNCKPRDGILHDRAAGDICDRAGHATLVAWL